MTFQRSKQTQPQGGNTFYQSGTLTFTKNQDQGALSPSSFLSRSIFFSQAFFIFCQLLPHPYFYSKDQENPLKTLPTPPHTPTPLHSITLFNPL